MRWEQDNENKLSGGKRAKTEYVCACVCVCMYVCACVCECVNVCVCACVCVLARRLITVAMSDILCWFPIGLLGLLASSGTPVPGEVNVAMAILVLPINSALNPFLYTLNTILTKRQRVAERRLQKLLLSRLESEEFAADENLCGVYSEKTALSKFVLWLDSKTLTSDQVMNLLLETEKNKATDDNVS